jgi:quercetin dioxygenase-like cupin family protein
MKKASILHDVYYNQHKPLVSVLMESDFTREIRIVFKENQVMKEHQTPFPIVVQVFQGEINFGVQGKVKHLKSGDMLCLAGGIPHDLKAVSDSIIRLTLSKPDHSSRVKNVVEAGPP